jgi:hypothetical protein
MAFRNIRRMSISPEIPQKIATAISVSKGILHPAGGLRSRVSVRIFLDEWPE